MQIGSNTLNVKKEGLSLENTLWANTVIASSNATGIVIYSGREIIRNEKMNVTAKNKMKSTETKTITLNEDCNSISQLQTIQITENVILNCFMNTENKKVYCSKGEYDKEKEEYNLNEFTTDLTCPSESFSIDKLANNYIIISCPGGEREQPHYILYDSNKKIKGQGELYANDPQSSRGPHYMRDFTITPSGDIYILANHPPVRDINCDYFHKLQF